MGRASSRSHRVAATPLAARRGGNASRLHPDADRLWMVCGQELMEVCELMHRAGELSESEHARVCELMETVGATAGLTRPWRITDAGAGPRLTYIRVFEERMPAAPNYFEYDTVQDDFDGRLIDDLPESRYLGRLVQDLATVHGQRAAAAQ